jgi:hypothetical protein
LFGLGPALAYTAKHFQIALVATLVVAHYVPNPFLLSPNQSEDIALAIEIIKGTIGMFQLALDEI